MKIPYKTIQKKMVFRHIGEWAHGFGPLKVEPSWTHPVNKELEKLRKAAKGPKESLIVLATIQHSINQTVNFNNGETFSRS